MESIYQIIGNLTRRVRDFTNNAEEENNPDTGPRIPIFKYTKEWFLRENLPIPMKSDLDYNGLEACGHIIPEEMLCLIFTHVDPEDLLQCRLVCHRWRSIIDSQIWLLLLEKNVYKKLQKLLGGSETPFSIYYKVYKNNPFNRNLIKNPSGEEGLKHWDRLKDDGDRWIVEKPPCGSFPLPEGSTSCFVTSFRTCIKDQVIDLRKEGLLPVIMDELRPKIYVSEIIAARFDCASTYKLEVDLLDRKLQELDRFSTQEIVLYDNWRKVEHCFENYPSGVYYVRFTHAGKDNQYWKGHYGSKMSQACVKVVI